MIVNIPRRGTIYKRQLLQKYTYNICAENAYNPGYVTEKVFQSLEAGCIPIYWGNCPTEPSILNQEYIVDATMSPMRLVSKIEQIQKDAPSTKDIWNPDALISIFSTYLKMWSVVVKKLKPSKLNPSYPIIYYNYCRSLEECAEKLVSHWRVSKKLWYPRIHFRMYVPETRDNKEIWMEDLADLLYDRYKTTIIS
jgi:hypothetical protein